MTRGEFIETTDIDAYVGRAKKAMENTVSVCNEGFKRAMLELPAIPARKRKERICELLTAYSKMGNLCILYGDQFRLYSSQQCDNAYRITTTDENVARFRRIAKEFRELVDITPPQEVGEHLPPLDD